MDGSLAVLKSSFSELVADGEHGIFAIGIDLTDPDFSLGSIVLLNGDDGWFRQSVPRLDAAVLTDLASILSSATAAVDRVCTIRKGHHVLRLRNEQAVPAVLPMRSEEHTSELQSLMSISYAVFCLKKKKYIDKKIS